MWMDAYVQEMQIRERIADAQQRAAMNHLLSGLKPPRTRRRPWEVISCLLRRWTKPAPRETIDVPHGSATRP